MGNETPLSLFFKNTFLPDVERVAASACGKTENGQKRQLHEVPIGSDESCGLEQETSKCVGSTSCMDQTASAAITDKLPHDELQQVERPGRTNGPVLGIPGVNSKEHAKAKCPTPYTEHKIYSRTDSDLKRFECLSDEKLNSLQDIKSHIQDLRTQASRKLDSSWRSLETNSSSSVPRLGFPDGSGSSNSVRSSEFSPEKQEKRKLIRQVETRRRRLSAKEKHRNCNAVKSKRETAAEISTLQLHKIMN